MKNENEKRVDFYPRLDRLYDKLEAAELAGDTEAIARLKAEIAPMEAVAKY
jgi:hypothetical protein